MIWLTVLLLLAKPVGYVNDFAEIISPAVEARLEADLENYTAESSNELAVVTLKSLDGEPIENTAVDLFEQWGIGKKNQDNGILFLVAPNEREMRIEVGYGLEPVLTDARAGTIIRGTITPKFKENDYDGGISDGVAAIMAVLGGGELPQPVAANNDDGLAALMIIFIIVIAVILLARRAKKHPWHFSKSSWGGWSSGKSGGGRSGGFSGGRSGGGGASGRW